jgi:aspartate kinase
MSAVAHDRCPDGHHKLTEDRLPGANCAAPRNVTGAVSGREVVAFKFGGSSLLGADRMLHSAQLVSQAAGGRNMVIVVSAMKGITDRLLAIARTLVAGCRTDARRDAENILCSHLQVLQDLQLQSSDRERLEEDLRCLGKDLLHDASPEKQPCSVLGAALQDRLASYGERFSAKLFSAALAKYGLRAVPLNSSEFVLTCDTFRSARPHMQETRRRGRELLLPLFDNGLIPVVTGFIGATCDGRVTTLGRNSSDFSGALVAHVVDASDLVIWTDVDGIYTDNPHESVDAQLLHELSYDEAHALAAAGAKVLHANVLPLAAENEMVVWVRNTFNPQFRGTRIGPVPVNRGEVLSSSAYTQLTNSPPGPSAFPEPLGEAASAGSRSESVAAHGRSRGISRVAAALPASQKSGYACELFHSRGAE